MKNLDPDKNNNSYYIVTVKNVSYIKIHGVNSLYLFLDKINEYNKKSNENRYLTLFLTDESKGTRKSMQNYEKKSEMLLDQ